jgi:hypothetical protein
MKNFLPLSFLLISSTFALAQKSILDEQGEIVFDGYIGEHYDIVMILKKDTGNKFEGRYIYRKQAAFISLSGELNDNKLQLSEKDPKGKETGKFIIDLNAYPTLNGTWTKPNGKGELKLYAKKMPVPGPGANKPEYVFLKVRSTKVGGDTVVVASGLPAPVLEKINTLLHATRDGEMQSMKSTVEYNLNGILTVVYNESSGSGFSSAQYVCINTKEGRPLKFRDIFQEGARSKLLELYEAKVREYCGDQLGKDYKPASKDLDNPIVTHEGITFISPCQRSIGYYSGPFTVEMGFDEAAEFMKK